MSDYPSTPSYGANYGSREQANPPYLPPSYPNQYMQQDNGRGAQGHMAQNYDTSMSAYAYNGAVPSFNSAAVASGVPPLPIFQGWHQDPVPLPPYNPQQNSTQYPPPNNNSQFVPQYYTSYNQQSYPSNVQTPKRYEQGELSEGEFEDNGHNGQATNTPPVGYGASHYPNVATNYGDSSTPTGYSAAREPSTQSYPANNHTYPRHPSAQLRRQQSGSYSPYVTSPAGDYDEHHNDHRPKTTSASNSQHQTSAPLQAQGKSPPPAFPSQAAPRSFGYHNPSSENKAVPAKSSIVDSTVQAPADHDHDTSLAESRKKAEAAILDLSFLDIPYQQYVEEGLGEEIIGSLFDRLKLSRNSAKSMNSGLPATSSLISQVKIGHSVGQQAASLRTDEQRKPEQLALVTSGPHVQPTQSPASTPESAAMTEKKRTLQFKMEALKKSREERAKNAAAAKDAKQVTKQNAASPVAAPVTAPVPAVAAPIPPPVAAPIIEAPERKVDVQPKPVPASFDSPSVTPFTPKPQSQIPINPALSKSPAPTVVPQLRQQPSIPGLFLASNAIPGLQQSTSNTPVSSTSTAQRKRPVAADFDDPIPAMTPFKRPFGHQRDDQKLVINVSDESEDEDVAMELDSGDQDSPVLPVQPERNMSNYRFAAARTSAQASNKPWTPPPFPAASSTPPSSIPGLSQPVRHTDLETSIKELKRQIAEKEAKKKAKQTPSRARTPRLEEGSGSREISTTNGFPPPKVAPSTVIQQMVTVAQNQVNTDEQNLIDAQAAEAEKAAELFRNEQEQKRLLREQNAANQSLVDAEVLQSRSKLEELRAAMAEAEAAYTKSLEEKRKLKEEADRLEQEAELQAEKDREREKEVAIKQPPPATDQNIPSSETIATTTELPAPMTNGVSNLASEHPEEVIEKAATPAVDNETTSMELDSFHNLTNGTQHPSGLDGQHEELQVEEATLDNASSNQALEAALQEAVRADADAQSSDKGDADIDVEMEIDMEDSYAPDPSHLAPESISGMSAGKEDSPSYSPVLHRTEPQSQDQEDDYEPPEATEPVEADAPDSPPFSPAPPDFVPETAADEPMDMSPIHLEQHDAVHEQVTDEFDVNPTQGGPEEGHGAGELLPSVIGSSPKLVEHGSEDVFETPKYTPYESPLKRFRAYRFHPEFNHDIAGGLRSKTYSHRIDPNKEFCRFELSGGVCNDTTCDLQHFKDIVLPDDAILTALGSPEEFKDEQRNKFCDGLKGILMGLRVRKVRDFDIIASEIVAHRAEFLGDKSKVLPLEGTTI